MQFSAEEFRKCTGELLPTSAQLDVALATRPRVEADGAASVARDETNADDLDHSPPNGVRYAALASSWTSWTC